LPCVDRPSI